MTKMPAIWFSALLLMLVASACTSTANPPEPSTGSPVTSAVPESLPLESTTTTEQPVAPTTSTIPVPVHIDSNGFNDHTVPVVASRDEFFALAKDDVSGRSVLKFNVPDMLNSTQVNWMDSNFYALHDEWYFFRLLNNQPIPAVRVTPVAGNSFETIADIYAWVEANNGRVPPGLRVIDADTRNGGDRIYAPEFYRAAINTDPRNYGAGSLLYMPESANDGGERWLIELEYTDAASPAEIALFFERLAPQLPEEIGSQLEWVLRSPEHEATAEEMTINKLPFHNRIVRFSELVPPGEVQVYNEGIAAGRLLIIEEGRNALTDATDESIILVENVPDYLPPAAALISSSPQTPLAHVNILARNRGIPNASQSGLLDDPGIRQAARIRAHAIVRATASGELEIVLITRDEYNDWKARQQPSPISVPQIDLTNLPLVIDLGDLASDIETDSDLDRVRPIIGGKSAGMVNIIGSDGVTIPERPVAITVRPYFEHLATLQPTLDAMLNNTDFGDSARVRFLFLEGPQRFVERYPDPNDIEFLAAFRADHPTGSTLGDLIEAGGFRDLFRAQPFDDSTLDAITATLETHYRDLSVQQGLRFRSSSSVEDIEGFNGAGLYDSNTGFLQPRLQESEGDQKKSIEKAILKTWASYWGYEAVEERILESVDHRSGGMAVLVHPRFDDDLEINNGVATFTLLPDGSANRASVTINSQIGATSVTNPEAGTTVQPEVVTVTIGRDGVHTISRGQTSTLTDAAVLDNGAVDQLVQQLEAVTETWLERTNAGQPAEQHSTTLTLDFEFKTMDEGWPTRSDNEISERRLVIKQARTLEPSLRDLPDTIRNLPAPPDLLARARSVEIEDCSIRITTDPLLGPDMGWSDQPWELADALPCPSDQDWVAPSQELLDLLAQGENLAIS